MATSARVQDRLRRAGAVAVVVLGLAAAPATAAPADGPSAGAEQPGGTGLAGAELTGNELDGTELAGGRALDLVAGRYVPRAVDLGVPGERSEALLVSESGVVVGSVYGPDSQRRTFRWRDGTLEFLSGLEYSVPTDVNRAGQVTLYGSGPWFRSQAFLWEVDGSLTHIFEHDMEVGATDVNDRGEVTFQYTSMSSQVGGRWVRGQGGEGGEDGQLLLHEGAVESGVAGGDSLNERGDVLGWLLEPDHETYSGWIWRDGVVTYLREPGGVSPTAINDRGQVLAYTAQSGAVLYERDGRLRPLDPTGLGFRGRLLNNRGVAAGAAVPTGATTRRAAVADVRGVRFLGRSDASAGAVTGLTDHGVAVGWSARDASGAPRATAWVLGARITLGDTVGGVAGVQSTANAVNERGLVVGTVASEMDGAGQPARSRAVVWELVPRW